MLVGRGGVAARRVRAPMMISLAGTLHLLLHSASFGPGLGPHQLCPSRRVGCAPRLAVEDEQQPLRPLESLRPGDTLDGEVVSVHTETTAWPKLFLRVPVDRQGVGGQRVPLNAQLNLRRSHELLENPSMEDLEDMQILEDEHRHTIINSKVADPAPTSSWGSRCAWYL